MRAVDRSPSLYPALSPGPDTFEVAILESNTEDVAGTSIDGNTTLKEVAVSDFDLQSYKRVEVRPTTF